MVIMSTYLFIFGLLAFAVADDEHYDLEKVDVEALCSDIGEIKKFNDCLINKGPCTELYLSYKVHIPESTRQGCRKCTVEQKRFAYHYFETLKKYLPDDYILFRQVYDPENKYFDALLTELNKYKNV